MEKGGVIMRVLITGASGYFAGELFRQLRGKADMEIIAVSSNPQKLSPKYQDIFLVSNTDFLNGAVDFPEIDIVIHSAFCRKSEGSLLVNSLNFLRNVVQWSVEHDVKGFINLSSQAVFGSGEGELPDETVAMNPEYLYALAKSASELILEEMAAGKMAFTNIRLASLLGPSGSVPNNVLYKFICTGLEGKDFKVVGGKQKFSFLDVRDAAEAVGLFMEIPCSSWEKAYNLGPEKQTNMMEMADCVCKKIFEKSGLRVSYEFLPDDTQLNAGMNSNVIYRLLRWKPKYSFEKIVDNTIEYVIMEKKEIKNAKN